MGMAPPGAGAMTHIRTPYGPITVNPAAAEDFSGFYNELAQGGAPIKSLGSYNARQMRWSKAWSSHAYGAATDIDDATEFSPAMAKWVQEHPQQWQSALASHHMTWGRYFPHRDDPHIEWTGPGKNRTDIDSAMKHTVEGNAHVSIDVNAPKGVRTFGSHGGLFKRMTVNRQTQMEPASTSLANVARTAGEE
jgi:hypothetical protein